MRYALVIAALALGVFGILQWLVLQERRSAPLVTIVVPAGYCGEIAVFQADDPAPEVPPAPGDAYLVFNLAGEPAVLAQIPGSADGLRTRFAAYAEDGARDAPLYVAPSGTSRWTHGMKNFYVLSPESDADCLQADRPLLDQLADIQRRYEAQLAE